MLHSCQCIAAIAVVESNISNSPTSVATADVKKLPVTSKHCQWSKPGKVLASTLINYFHFSY